MLEQLLIAQGGLGNNGILDPLELFLILSLLVVYRLRRVGRRSRGAPFLLKAYSTRFFFFRHPRNKLGIGI